MCYTINTCTRKLSNIIFILNCSHFLFNVYIFGHKSFLCTFVLVLCLSNNGSLHLFRWQHPDNVLFHSSKRIPFTSKGLVINYGEGGLQNGKIVGPKLFAPPPQDRVKLFAPPLLKSGNFSCPLYKMAKTSSYCVNTTPKLFVPPPLQHHPFSWG